MQRRLWVFVVGCLFMSSMCWAQSLEYRDEARKFSITGPEGWKRQDGGRSTEVSYIKDPERPIPTIGVTIDSTIDEPVQITSALAFSNLVLSRLPRSWSIVVVESPHDIELHGWRGSRLAYERIAQMKWNTRPITFRNIYWQFMQGDEIISLVAIVENNSDVDLVEIQRCVDSFHRLP